MPKDYYMVLGVSRGADPEEIKKAYREVAKKYHPDATRSKESTQRFLEIREAYETLSNEKKRKEYDRELARRESGIKAQSLRSSLKTPSPVNDAAWRLSSFLDDFLLRPFWDFLEGFEPRAREKDIYYEAILSPSEAIEGRTFSLKVPVGRPCPRCSRMHYPEDLLCSLCSGKGMLETEREITLRIPPGIRHGTNIRFPLDSIGLRNCCINLRVLIDRAT
ncbi:MAG: DnaJ domain-containing protein [Deltaproteobacteria bacterium]|nr:DnaJ domain-containing protein [Deltaproteobacteria bacterium]